MHGVSTRKVDDLVAALGIDAGVSKSQVSRLWATKGDLLDGLALREAERRWPGPGVARVQRVEAIVVEVVQHGAHWVLGREGHLGDLGNVHALGRQQHHLRSSPRHHRPRGPAHDPQQTLALLVADLPDLDSLAHRTALAENLA